MTSKKIKVSVTKEDIENGKAQKCSECPVALAIARALGIERVTVTGAVLYSTDPNKRDVYACLPPEVRRFIDRFDDGLKCEPSTFTLQVWGQT